ncbi:hypothetical protein [Candidatus Uabimicrobium sp. HlEnr_7]|uniref:hypothetical protein n=1 Tax=Candidatus Uabimicrobium helgolandensis TaxID=3095367 RepID=UPI003557D7DC
MNFPLLSFVKETTWDEIIQTWKQDEIDQVFWQKIYKQYSSWEKWREHCLQEFNLPKNGWRVYRIDDPELFATKAYCGPFNTWFKHYAKDDFPTKEERDLSSFGYIVPRSVLSRNPKIASIMENFPDCSQVLGVTDGEKFMLYEGHHRMCALTLAKEQGIKISTELYIAVHQFSTVDFYKHFYPQRTCNE